MRADRRVASPRLKVGLVSALVPLMLFPVTGCWGPAHYSATTQTWTWDGHGWQALSAADVGGKPEQHLAYDSGHRQLVLIGRDPNSLDSTTATWTAGRWALSKADTPPAGNWTMAYDTRAQRLLMFDGDAVYYWTGSDWSKTAKDPGQPSWIAMGLGISGPAPDPTAYDPHLGAVINVDRNCNRPAPSVIAAWDGTTWTAQPVGPSSDYGDLVFDRARDVMLMVGADCASQPVVTWAFDGKEWKQVHPTNEPVVDATSNRWDYASNLMAYDPDTRQVLVIGRSSLWAWDGVNWTEVPGSNLPRGVNRDFVSGRVGNTTQVAYDDVEHRLVAISTAISCDPCPNNPVT